MVLHHRTCDHDTHTDVACAACRDPLRAEDTTSHLGSAIPPGWPSGLTCEPCSAERARS